MPGTSSTNIVACLIHASCLCHLRVQQPTSRNITYLLVQGRMIKRIKAHSLRALERRICLSVGRPTRTASNAKVTMAPWRTNRLRRGTAIAKREHPTKLEMSSQEAPPDSPLRICSSCRLTLTRVRANICKIDAIPAGQVARSV